MMGLGFTLGFVLSLLIQLPVITLPTHGKEIQVSHSENENLTADDLLKTKLESIANEGKRATLDNSLRGLKNSLHGVVFATNNGSKSYLEEKTQHILSNSRDYQKTSDSKSAISDKNKSEPREILQRSNEWSQILTNIFNGVFWSPSVENKCPHGFGDHHQKHWMDKSSKAVITKMTEGCGRMQNRMLTFSDGSRACARYRMNTDQIQGEIYSFYLGKLLKLTNLPPTTLKLSNSKSSEWRQVHADMANSQWSDSKVIVMTQWIDNLDAAYIPKQLRNDDRKLHPGFTSGSIETEQSLCELVQWSDLVIFDYLTANLDRVVNNMFNKQWNSQMMDSPAHNLEQQKDGHLVFLDNESGLFHGYRLLDKYSTYHKALLDSLCVFRNSTAQVIEDLYHSKTVGEQLHELFTQNEPLYKHIPKIPKKNSNILQQRVNDVHAQIQKCKAIIAS